MGRGKADLHIAKESAKVRKSLKKKQPEKRKTEWEGTRRWREKRVGNFEPEGKRPTTKNIFERERE